MPGSTLLDTVFSGERTLWLDSLGLCARRRLRRAAVMALAWMAALFSGCAGSSPAPRSNGSGHRVHPFAPADVRTRPVASTTADAAAVDHVLSHTNYVQVGSRRRKDVALTFDDGPSPYTHQILAILEHAAVPATFFEIGREVQSFPALTLREAREGFAIGDHTLTHPALAALPAARQEMEIAQGAARILSAGAQAPRLFRPPYGSFNSNTLAALRSRRMLMVLWSVDTKDYSRPGVQRIVYTALSGARAGAIILMHDGGGPRDQTVQALPRIIRGLKRRGFHMVTVTQLVADDPPLRSQPPPVALSGTG